MPKLPFGTLTITDHAKELIIQALNENRLSSGKFVHEFERKFAELIGVKEAVAVSSGGDADALALAVLYDYGAERGDEVIVPALSFVATGNSVLQAGFKPVFVDIDPFTLNIDVNRIEEKISDKTRAIMVVHLMGKPVDMDKVNEIAARYGLYVIEDAAEAHGAIYKGKAVGGLGDLGAFSLYVAHIISTIEGGIVVTDKPEFAAVLRSLRCHGRACNCKVCLLNTTHNLCIKRFKNDTNSDIRFTFERIGFSSKMNELEAAVGLGNLEIYHDILEKRRKNLYYLLEKVSEYEPYIYSIKKEPHEEIGPHALPLILGPDTWFSREELMNFLESNGVETRTLFSSMPTQCKGFRFLGHKLGEFPNAEYIGNNGLHVGVHHDLGIEECDYFLNVLDEFFRVSRRQIKYKSGMLS